jgi:hypothetical protein
MGVRESHALVLRAKLSLDSRIIFMISRSEIVKMMRLSK